MRLSDTDKRILRALEISPADSLEVIARGLKLKGETVRRKVARFRSIGLIVPRVLVNTFALGLERYSLFASLGNPSRKTYESFVQTLIQSNKVSLVLELSGDFEFEINFTVSGNLELRDFLESLFAKHEMHLSNKALGIQINHIIYGTKSLVDLPIEATPLGYSCDVELFKADDLDRQILHYCVEKATIEASVISKLLRVPLSTISYRIRKMRQAGVLLGVTHLIESGNLHHYIVLVYSKGFDLLLREDLAHFCKEEPNIFYSVESVGAWDFELGVTVQNRTALIDTLRSFQSRFGSRISQTKVLNILTRRLVRDFSINRPVSASLKNTKRGVVT